MGMRRGPALLSLTLISLILLGACSDASRHRALKFFFDGVPEPGAAPSDLSSRDSPDPSEPDPARKKIIPRFSHAPFRENRCGACHDLTTGQTYRTDQEGLCFSCHAEVTEAPPYLHGPVAARACLYCHEPHGSVYPGLLVAELPRLCDSCHDPQELTQGEYHGMIQERSCTDCHHPHGADNRFFLRPEP